MTKRSRKPKARAPRLTITLENAMGIAKQTWVGTPCDFHMSWPVDVMTLMGERMAHMVVTPPQIDFTATLVIQGSQYTSDHSKP